MIRACLLLIAVAGCEDDFSLGRNRDGFDAGRPGDGGTTDGGTDAAAPCAVAGCSGQVCTGDPTGVDTSCEWREEYACYRTATCARQADGSCGWTDTPELRMCLAEGGPIAPPQCFVSGCSGTICTDDPDGVITTCEWREWYACYRAAACEPQSDGACGWTNTPELQSCLMGG